MQLLARLARASEAIVAACTRLADDPQFPSSSDSSSTVYALSRRELRARRQACLSAWIAAVQFDIGQGAAPETATGNRISGAALLSQQQTKAPPPHQNTEPWVRLATTPEAAFQPAETLLHKLGMADPLIPRYFRC